MEKMGSSLYPFNKSRDENEKSMVFCFLNI